MRPVGFQRVGVPDADGRPFAVGIGYPTHARPRPTTFLGGLCADPGQFDREAFHAAMNASVVAFFGKPLKKQ